MTLVLSQFVPYFYFFRGLGKDVLRVLCGISGKGVYLHLYFYKNLSTG